MKRWELVFKALANINRLKIIRLLNSNQKLNVTELSERLNISFTATSRHLIILRNFQVITSKGKDNHVFYYINPELPQDFKKILSIVI